MQRRIEIELENMAYLNRTYLTEVNREKFFDLIFQKYFHFQEEDNLYERDPIRKEQEEKTLALKRRQEEIPEHIYLKRDLLDRVSWYKKWE